MASARKKHKRQAGRARPEAANADLQSAEADFRSAKADGPPAPVGDFPEFVVCWNETQKLATPELHVRIARWLSARWAGSERELLLLAFRPFRPPPPSAHGANMGSSGWHRPVTALFTMRLALISLKNLPVLGVSFAFVYKVLRNKYVSRLTAFGQIEKII